MKPPGVSKKNREFDPNTFLATIGEGRKTLAVSKKQSDLHPRRCRRCRFLHSEG